MCPAPLRHLYTYAFIILIQVTYTWSSFMFSRLFFSLSKNWFHFKEVLWYQIMGIISMINSKSNFDFADWFGWLMGFAHKTKVFLIENTSFFGKIHQRMCCIKMLFLRIIGDDFGSTLAFFMLLAQTVYTNRVPSFYC